MQKAVVSKKEQSEQKRKLEFILGRTQISVQQLGNPSRMGQEGFASWNCRFIFSELSYSSKRSPPLMQKEGSNPVDSQTACFPSRKHSNSIEEANLEKPFRQH